MKFYKIVSFKRHNESGIVKCIVKNKTTGVIVSEEYVDLYHSEYNNIQSQYEEFKYWVTITNEDDYELIIQPAGFHNPLCAGNNFGIDILKFYMVFESTPTVQASIKLWHSNNPEIIYTFNAINNEVVYTNQQVVYVADGFTTKFYLPVTKKAEEFLRISDNGGATWIYPNDSRITWGSNETVDDNLIKDGMFGVKVNIPPEFGRSIVIDFQPKYNMASVSHTLTQPFDPNNPTSIDYGAPVSLVDYSLEFLK